ncbi:hypothetical protein ACPPVO_45220 [Dactylosporangium sp. McL0621]|uniref:hypothetical protein n=1 Tax=Dactylosporangium sp. McL0621 TaxID=3415678 RepID=UPI003CF7D93D
MNPPLIAWADAEGRGFAPLRTSDTASSAAPEFWAAATQLIDDDVVAQPSVRSTMEHPVYSLRAVHVGRRPYWCFAEQGRGGPFGVAGTCRFQFLPFDLEAGQAWTDGIAAVGGKEPLAAGHADEAAVRRALTGLLLGQPLVRLPGSPAEAAVTIFAVLSVLPRAVASTYAWSTCPLQEPRPNLVTADLPADFRTGSPLERVIDRVRWSAAPGAEAVQRRLAAATHRSAFELLVGLAVRLEVDQELLAVPVESLAALVEHTAATRVLPTPENVPTLLRDRDGRTQLARFPGVVTQWAARHEQAALTALGSLREPVLREAILNPLFDHLLDGSLAGHTKAAAALVREATPEPGPLADLIRGHRVDGTMTAPDAWLRLLDISPWDHPDLYTDPSPLVVAELNAQGFTIRARDLLRARGPRFARRVLEQMPRLGPATAAGLVAAAAQRSADGSALDDGDLFRLGPILVARADTRQTEQWLLEFDNAARANQTPRRAVRQVLFGAVSDLLSRGRLRDPRLVELIQRAVASATNNREPVPSPLQRAGEAPKSTVYASAGAPAAGEPGHDRPRRWSWPAGGAEPDRRGRLVWGVALAGAAATLVSLAIWVGQEDGGQPGGPSATSAPVTSTTPSKPRLTSAATATPFRVTFDRAKPDETVAEIQGQLQVKAPGRRVVYVVLSGAGPDPAAARANAAALADLLTQRHPAELGEARYVIGEQPIAVDQKSRNDVELLVISEEQ